MPRGQKFLGGLGVPAVIMTVGLVQGGYFGQQNAHPVAAPVIAGLLSGAVAVMFFGRITVATPEGIACGYVFLSGRPIPWARITDVTVAEKMNVKGGLSSWHRVLHLEGGSGVRLPVPYAVGKQPSAAFCAEYEAIRQRWHQERLTQSLGRDATPAKNCRARGEQHLPADARAKEGHC
jgi:hypothetical protein